MLHRPLGSRPYWRNRASYDIYNWIQISRSFTPHLLSSQCIRACHSHIFCRSDAQEPSFKALHLGGTPVENSLFATLPSDDYRDLSSSLEARDSSAINQSHFAIVGISVLFGPLSSLNLVHLLGDWGRPSITESQQPARHTSWSYGVWGALGKELGCITIGSCTTAITLDLLGLYCLLTPRETARLGEAKKTMCRCMCTWEWA